MICRPLAGAVDVAEAPPLLVTSAVAGTAVRGRGCDRGRGRGRGRGHGPAGGRERLLLFES